MYSDRNLSQCHCVNSSHLDRVGTETGATATRKWVGLLTARGMSRLTCGRGRSRSYRCPLSAVEVLSIVLQRQIVFPFHFV